MRPSIPIFRNGLISLHNSTKHNIPKLAIASIILQCTWAKRPIFASYQSLIQNYIPGFPSYSTNSTSTSSPPWTTPFVEATDYRRSIYTLNSTSSAKDSEIVNLAEQCLLTVPSAFNSQTTRMTILFNDDHRKLWDLVGRTLLDSIGRDRYNSGTGARIEGFKNAHGSILFFDDKQATDKLRENGGELYGPKAEEWTHQSNGMHQYYMWTALETYGLGVNLQHYNPLIDDEVKKIWDLPDHWNLRAQMVFGDRKEGTVIKDKEQKLAMEDRLKSHGSKD